MPATVMADTIRYDLKTHYMKYLVFISFIILYFSSFAQKSVDIKVIDNKKQVMPFCALYFKNAKIGTLTDENGLATLNIPANNDTLLVQMMGHDTKLFSVSSLKTNELNVLIINESELQLEEVEVTAKRNRSRIERIGFYWDYPTSTLNSSHMGIGQEGSFIMHGFPNKTNTNGIIQELYFDTPGLYQVYPSLIRPRIFTIGPDFKPTGDLLKDSKPIRVHRYTNRIIVDVSEFNIRVPKNGVGIGYEFLGYYTKSKLVKNIMRQSPLYAQQLIETVRANPDDGASWNWSIMQQKWWIYTKEKSHQPYVAIKCGFTVKND
jgi:CarboxypepD_reg-like domain